MHDPISHRCAEPINPPCTDASARLGANFSLPHLLILRARPGWQLHGPLSGPRPNGATTNRRPDMLRLFSPPLPRTLPSFSVIITKSSASGQVKSLRQPTVVERAEGTGLSLPCRSSPKSRFLSPFHGCPLPSNRQSGSGCVACACPTGPIPCPYTKRSRS